MLHLGLRESHVKRGEIASLRTDGNRCRSRRRDVIAVKVTWRRRCMVRVTWSVEDVAGETSGTRCQNDHQQTVDDDDDESLKRRHVATKIGQQLQLELHRCSHTCAEE